MKKRIILYSSIGFFITGALLFLAAVKILLPSAAAAKAVSLLEKVLHTTDSIEISVLSPAAKIPNAAIYRTKLYPEDYAITSHTRLTTEQTKEFLDILRRHVLSTSSGAGCHDPGFLLRFTRKGRTILTCSLCLHCTNIEIEPFPFSPIWVSIFDKQSKDLSVPEIENFLSNLLKHDT